MTLRIVWSCYPRNTGLAIAANIFVYVGTIILYMLNWFFVQRIVRAQHTHLGWSAPYRIFHRVGLALLVITLLMLIISQIWQFFTLDSRKMSVFHAFFLTGQTYFTAFCIAPAVLVLLSVLLPRTEVEKFGAGRLRINITILLIAVAVLSIGQIFRCVLAWIPATPLQPVQSGSAALPWYLTKACFYCFNFVTEIIVIIMFAVVRVDLRFHVPNGSRKSGDYSSSRVNLNKIDSEKNVVAPRPMVHHNNSSETLHRYHSSVFEDTQTLADSLRYPSSTLEVDEKTGNWKVKRMSGETSSRTSISFSPSTRTSLHNRDTLVDADAPPVPEIPTQWPLPDAVPPRSSAPVLEHTNPPSRRGTPKRTFELEGHQLNNVNVGDAVTDALTKLEMNSERNKFTSPTPPPRYDITSPLQVYQPTLPTKNESRHPSRETRKRSVPLHAAAESSRSRANSSNASAINTPPISETSEIPGNAEGLTSISVKRSSPSLEIICLLQRMSGDPQRIQDASLQKQEVNTAEGSDNSKEPMTVPQSEAPSRQTSSKYSDDTTSSDAREVADADDEFRRFSYEAPPREL